MGYQIKGNCILPLKLAETDEISPFLTLTSVGLIIITIRKVKITTISDNNWIKETITAKIDTWNETTYFDLKNAFLEKPKRKKKLKDADLSIHMNIVRETKSNGWK